MEAFPQVVVKGTEPTFKLKIRNVFVFYACRMLYIESDKSELAESFSHHGNDGRKYTISKI